MAGNLAQLASRLTSGAFYAVGLGAFAAMADACLYTGEFSYHKIVQAPLNSPPGRGQHLLPGRPAAPRGPIRSDPVHDPSPRGPTGPYRMKISNQPRNRPGRALNAPPAPATTPGGEPGVLSPPPRPALAVDGGERAVIFDRFEGVKKETTAEGTHFILPWIQKPFVMDIRTRPRSISSVTGTKDLQMVNITVRVLSRPHVEALPTIFSNLGEDWDERVLPSIVNEVLKATVAQYNAESLLTKREMVSRQVREALRSRAEEFNITLEDVAITHLSYGYDFAKAIESKQVAEQDAERAKWLVTKADQERLAAVIRAEGEAEAAKLISDATKQVGPALIDLRRIEAAKEIAAVLSASRGVVYLPAGQQTLIGINPGQ